MFNLESRIDWYCVNAPSVPNACFVKYSSFVTATCLKTSKVIACVFGAAGLNVLSKFNPATPNGIVTYLKDNNYQFDGKNALVIGRSNIVGKPMFNMLLNLNMTVTIAHSHTSKEDLKRLVANSDLIIVAVGKPNFITNEFNFKKGAYVFDVGINRVEGKLVGDCEPNLNVEFQSPVPGGVGLLTRLSLILNLLEVYKDEI